MKIVLAVIVIICILLTLGLCKAAGKDRRD
jgi:hypothetical protein